MSSYSLGNESWIPMTTLWVAPHLLGHLISDFLNELTVALSSRLLNLALGARRPTKAVLTFLCLS